jgi:excisionase family DNA binding protein
LTPASRPNIPWGPHQLVRNRHSANRADQMTHMPLLLTPNDVAELLRTSRKAIYTMVERGQLPGVVRIGRRVLVRKDALLDWLHQQSALSLQERQR